MRKEFQKRNEGFQCQKCQYFTPAASVSSRNHCPKCLYSLHVDSDTPGDRKSDCHGLMEPMELSYSGKKKYQINHRCVKCGKMQKNKLAPDDQWAVLLPFSMAP